MSALVVAIEGIDGSGKGTQARLLREALAAEGRSCSLIAFPRYDSTVFGRTIARYLNGEFGDLPTVGPHFAALLYAGDRLESLPLIQREIESHDVLIFDRYVPSNLAHQAAKLPRVERDPFIAWVESVEYGVYRLPRPDLVICLDIPVEHAQQLISQKSMRGYTAKPADLHEGDTEHLVHTAATYNELAGRDATWYVVRCCEGNQLRPPHSIQSEIVGRIRSALEQRGT